MLRPNNISQSNNLSKEQQHSLEKTMQETDLNYLSSVAFEKFKVTDSEIDSLNQLINKKTNSSSTNFNTILVSVLSGLLIGVSVFFVVFQKNKNHPSKYELIEDEKTVIQLPNKISTLDTIFPTIKSNKVEHFQTVINNAEQTVETTLVENTETLPSKPFNISLPKNEDNEDLIYQFTPNAPVIFIHNLKVAHYRLYYYKNNEMIDLNSANSLSAQYSNKTEHERVYINKTNTLLAHKIIKQAMRYFNINKINNCIDELMILYNYNQDDANAQFYLGMCYYQLGNYTIAENYFKKNLNNVTNVFHQESEYYQALCFINTKQRDEGIKQLQAISKNNGFYSVRAKETLEKDLK